MKLETVLSPAEFACLPDRDLGAAVCLVFDILRATTTMTTAFDRGAESIRPVREISEALAWRERDPSVLLAGERNGKRILAAETGSVDFDLGNSPREFTPQRVGGRRIVMTTTNGTRALAACDGAWAVFPASFLNLEAVAGRAADLRPKRVQLVCAGTGEEPAFEDILAAGAACDWFLQYVPGVELSDSSTVAWQIWTIHMDNLPGAMRFSKNGRRLLAEPDLAGDVPLCLLQNTSRVVAGMESGLIRPVTA
jgi:2-phosphosulfolactate phosphatase